jgi:hypothetical protein
MANKIKTPTSRQNQAIQYLDELILEGINITRACNTGINNPAHLIHEIHKSYILWVGKIKQSLNNKETTERIDIGFFYEGDSVPLFFGGIEYGNPQSKEYQKLLENIQIETKTKITRLREIRDELTNKKQPEKKTSLKKIEFIDKEAILKIGNRKCQLPPAENEHYLCQVMFRKKKDEFIDWSVIHEEITGDENLKDDYEKNKRVIYDTQRAVNARLKKDLGTDDDLFTWKDKTLKRNYGAIVNP